MLDHAFLDVIAAVRSSLEQALLERHTAEESLTMDVLLGDLDWETVYTLPGEGTVPRFRAEIALGWSTWSQTAYRSWATGLGEDEPPAVDVEVTLAVHDLAGRPDPGKLAGAVGTPPPLAGEEFHQALPSIEEHLTRTDSRFTAHVERTATVFLDEEALASPEQLQAVFRPLGPWVASTLVRLADLDLAFLPPLPEDDEA